MYHLASLKGTVVKASADGKIIIASTEIPGYGSLVEIKHSKGFTTRYGHLEEILVREGESVKRGDMIGRSGQKEMCEGAKNLPSHLHFEIRRYGESFNPLKYLYCSEVIFLGSNIFKI